MMMSITTSGAATTTTTSASSLDTLKMTDNEHQIKTSQSHGQLVLLQYWAKSSVFALPQNLGIANNKYHYPEFDVKPRRQGYLFTYCRGPWQFSSIPELDIKRNQMSWLITMLFLLVAINQQKEHLQLELWWMCHCLDEEITKHPLTL